MYALFREALAADCVAAGGAEVRSVLEYVDALLRTARHDRDRSMAVRQHLSHPGGTRSRVPDTTGGYRYGWLDVRAAFRSAARTPIYQLVILSYFFPRLKSILARFTYIQGDEWYTASYFPERKAQSPLYGALEPSRPPAPPSRGGRDPDDDLSVSDRVEKARQDTPCPPRTARPGPADIPLPRTTAMAWGARKDGLVCLVVRVLADLLSSEAKMLGDWAQFIRSVQPHIMTGYNVLKFDLPYLMQRAAVLGVRTMAYLSSTHEQVRIKRSVFTSRGTGAQKRVAVRVGGACVVMDMYTIMVKDHKLVSYKLNAVALHFLNRMKDDVAYHDITPMWERGDAGRTRVLRYCIKDALLPLELMRHLMVLFVKTELVRVTGVTLNTLFTRGQGVLTYSMLLRRALLYGRLCPAAEDKRQSDIQYEGATVVDPHRDFYKVPIATLDFASLYPSIMMAHNLCFSTFLKPGDARRLPSSSTEFSAFGKGGVGGAHFVKKGVVEGLLPQILSQVLAQRKVAKRAMKSCKLTGDSVGSAVMNGRQLALKVVANSIYGFCSAFILRNVAIGAAVTFWGRRGIDETKQLVEAYFSTTNGFRHAAEVVYGDTDSVMIKWGPDVSIREADALSKMAEHLLNEGYTAACAARCEGRFGALVLADGGRRDAVIGRSPRAGDYSPPPFLLEWTGYMKPMEIEAEKIYCPYLLMNKKRYAGLLYNMIDPKNPPPADQPVKPAYIDAKGLEIVRRDTPPFTRDTLVEIVRLLMYETVAKALAYAVARGARLRRGDVFMSDLIISKGLTKLQYANPQPHVTVYLERLRREPETAPRVGDRVPFVYVATHKKALAANAACDPSQALREHRPIDYDRYFENSFRMPVARLFLYVLRKAVDVHWVGVSKTVDQRNRTKATEAVATEVFKALYTTRCKKPKTFSLSKHTLPGYFSRIKPCAGCGKGVGPNAHRRLPAKVTLASAETDIEDLCVVVPRSSLCVSCSADVAAVTNRVAAGLRDVEMLVQGAVAKCVRCVGGVDWGRIQGCDNDACAHRTDRIEILERSKRSQKNARRIGLPCADAPSFCVQRTPLVARRNLL